MSPVCVLIAVGRAVRLRLSQRMVPSAAPVVVGAGRPDRSGNGRASAPRPLKEALANLREALELYFEDIPPPTGPKPSMVAPVEVHIPLAS